jgi:hypothetical protein
MTLRKPANQPALQIAPAGADGAAADRGADTRKLATPLEISLNNVKQLFNSLDPSPFYERDLDANAENFLVSWAQELPHDGPLQLTLHLREWPAEPQPEIWIAQAISRHFAERARFARLELKGLLRQGRASLVIGLSVMLSFLLLAQWLGHALSGVLGGLLRESFTIAGWVAMWRPMQIYLYDWWPLRRRIKLFLRMSRMPIVLRRAAEAAGARPVG